MPPLRPSRPPRWYTIPLRALLLTFIGTLLVFALSLFGGIFATVIGAVRRGVPPNMTVAYRHIALPVALVAACVIFVAALGMEIRHYRQTRTLAAIARVS
jgi:hypothetical protein